MWISGSHGVPSFDTAALLQTSTSELSNETLLFDQLYRHQWRARLTAQGKHIQLRRWKVSVTEGKGDTGAGAMMRNAESMYEETPSKASYYLDHLIPKLLKTAYLKLDKELFLKGEHKSQMRRLSDVYIDPQKAGYDKNTIVFKDITNEDLRVRYFLAGLTVMKAIEMVKFDKGDELLLSDLSTVMQLGGLIRDPLTGAGPYQFDGQLRILSKMSPMTVQIEAMKTWRAHWKYEIKNQDFEKWSEFVLERQCVFWQRGVNLHCGEDLGVSTDQKLDDKKTKMNAISQNIVSKWDMSDNNEPGVAKKVTGWTAMQGEAKKTKTLDLFKYQQEELKGWNADDFLKTCFYVFPGECMKTWNYWNYEKDMDTMEQYVELQGKIAQQKTIISKS